MTGPRPRSLVAVVGTGTDVGKTWVSAGLLRALRTAGATVAARKPAQSFDPGTGPTDAEILGEASGEHPTVVCPEARWYERALAPPMAAEALGRVPPRVADLVNELAWPDPAVDVGVVEGAGGVRSPLGADGDSIDLARLMAPDLVALVADAGLGTINAVRLAVDALAGGLPVGTPVAVVLNPYDESDLHRRNRAWLAERLGLPLLTSSPGGLATLAGLAHPAP